MAKNELKHITHSSMELICFTGGFGVDGARTSSNVGWGIPRRDGNKSLSSINSLHHIFSANFFGIGGECGPTESAWFVSSLATFEGDARVASGNCSDNHGL